MVWAVFELTMGYGMGYGLWSVTCNGLWATNGPVVWAAAITCCVIDHELIVGYAMGKWLWAMVYGRRRELSYGRDYSNLLLIRCHGIGAAPLINCRLVICGCGRDREFGGLCFGVAITCYVIV